MIQALNSPTKKQLKLNRYPLHTNKILHAWDSADELILNHLSGVETFENSGPKSQRIVVLNDQFGALSCSLEKFDLTTYTDSYVSFKGIQLNSENRLYPLSQLEALHGKYDLALIRIPKNMSFFEDSLAHLSQHLHPQSKVICGSMIKHLAPASFNLLNQYIGETTTSLAFKKARLIFAKFQREATPSLYPLKVHLDPGTTQLNTPFIHHSNLFSREKLDIGTRFLLNSIPQGNYPTILDLGCANGVIGIAAKKVNPDSKIIFSDESKMAVISAQINYANYYSDPAEFLWTNCYENQEPHSIDLVLCNPPFHQGNTLGTYIAKQMFEDAYRALKVGGQIRVIGNSHLQYQISLQRIFGNSQPVAKHNKFMIYDAIKSTS